MKKPIYTPEQLKKWYDIYEALPKSRSGWGNWLEEEKKELGQDPKTIFESRYLGKFESD